MRTYSLFFGCVLLATSGALSSADTSAQAGSSAQQNTSVTAGGSGASAAHSNTASASATSSQGQAQLAQGSEINATLSRPVDSRKNKPGDPVTATTTHDTRSDGQVIIPRNSKLLGHVTETRNRGDGKGEASGASSAAGNSAGAAGSASSALGIVFDQAVLKDGRTIPIHGTIQAVAASSSAVGGGMGESGSALATGASGVGSGSASGGGVLGGPVAGLTGTVGGAVHATGGVAGTLTRSPGAVGGLSAAGRLASGSHGIFGLDGYSLTSATSAAGEGSLVTSAGRSIHLDSGTQLLLVSGAQATGSVAKSEAREPVAQQKPTDRN